MIPFNEEKFTINIMKLGELMKKKEVKSFIQVVDASVLAEFVEECLTNSA